MIQRTLLDDVGTTPKRVLSATAALACALSLGLAACATPSSAPEDAPAVTAESSGSRETLVIMGLNDLHGALSPQTLKTKDENPVTYERGGASILAAHAKILRSLYGERFLILDGGDEFQGSVDSNLEQGRPVVQFLNYLGLTAAAVGNHEFDFGPQGTADGKDPLGALKERISEAKYPFLSANMYRKSGEFPALPGVKDSIIVNAGRLKVGLFGLTTRETPTTTRPDYVKDLEFRDLAKTAIEQSKKLREAGADLVVLVGHIGLYCDVADVAGKPPRAGLVKTESDVQSACRPKDEIPTLLSSIPAGTIDAVVAGHSHAVVHHWVNGVPVIESGTQNVYYNLMYLTVDLQTRKVVADQTKIEGPIPVCPKVFANQKNCNGDAPAPLGGRGRLVTPTLHGRTISPDSGTERLLEPFYEKTEAYKKRKIGKLNVRLEAIRHGESPLGSFIADSIRDAVKADFAMTNTGGIRANLESGDVLFEDLFRVLPFDNYISVVHLTGRELRKVLRIGENGSRGYFPTSGLKLKVIDPKYEPRGEDLDHNGRISPWELDRIVDIETEDGREIDPLKMYTVAILDFLLEGGDDYGHIFSDIPKNRIQLVGGPTFREAVMAAFAKHPEGVNAPSTGRLTFVPPPSRKSRGASKPHRSSRKKKH